ncbi:MAG: radical SAM protein [Desulfobacterota bacterium]|nr:radical SAM protein [Thermodesulfobacteriota bacterium]
MYPRFLEIEITGRCAYRCKHCYGSFPRAGELSTATVLRVLREARGLFDCVIFSGGEPLLHDGLADMVAAASREFAVFITTSGSGLTETLLKRIQGQAVLVFGMDGIGETHDRYRESPGAFARLVHCLEMTRQLPTEIIVTLWRDVIPEIDRIISFASAYTTILHFNGLIPVGRARLNRHLMPDRETLERTDVYLHELKRTMGWVVTDLHRVTESDRMTGIELFCKGRYNITPRGDVRPCEFHRAVLGNIYQRPLPDIIAAARDTELIRSREEGFIRHVRTDLDNPYDYHTTICHCLEGAGV